MGRASCPLQPAKHRQNHGTESQHIAEQSEPVKLPVPDNPMAVLRPALILKHERVAAVEVGVHDVEGTAAEPEA
jgi:hypothetical protein